MGQEKFGEPTGGYATAEAALDALEADVFGPNQHRS
jgi:hypothetical protein